MSYTGKLSTDGRGEDLRGLIWLGWWLRLLIVGIATAGAGVASAVSGEPDRIALVAGSGGVLLAAVAWRKLRRWMDGGSETSAIAATPAQAT